MKLGLILVERKNKYIDKSNIQQILIIKQLNLQNYYITFTRKTNYSKYKMLQCLWGNK